MKLALIVPWNLDMVPTTLMRSLWDSDIPRDAMLIMGGTYDPVLTRNRGILEGLAAGCEEFLFFDADQLFPQNIYAELSGAGHDIVSGLVPHGNYPHGYCVYRDHPTLAGREVQWVPDPALRYPVPVKKVGAGCLFVRRAVFEKIPAPWFKPEINETWSGWTRGEDFCFCDLVRQHGFEIWAHPLVFVPHLKKLQLHRPYVQECQKQALMDQLRQEAKDYMTEVVHA